MSKSAIATFCPCVQGNNEMHAVFTFHRQVAAYTIQTYTVRYSVNIYFIERIKKLKSKNKINTWNNYMHKNNIRAIKIVCPNMSKTKQGEKTITTLLLLRNVKAPNHNLWNFRPTKADRMTCWPVSHIY